MHHKNHKHSTSNHNNPQHQKPDYPSEPNPGGRYGGGYPTKPTPSTGRKSNFLKTIAAKFKEKPATEDEIKQLKLNTVREELKTRKQIAKTKRPSRFSGFGGGESRQPSYRRSSSHNDEGSFLFGGSNNKGGSFLDFNSGPSLGMFGGGQEKKSRKNQRSGLEEMF